MTTRTRTGILILMMAAGGAGCDGSRPPSAPSPIPTPSRSIDVTQDSDPVLRVFTEPGTGFSTTDVRDGRDHIVQFETSGNLIWTADNRRLPGFYTTDRSAYVDGFAASQNWFIVRFGTDAGQRRAYLTGVDGEGLNPGTLVNLEVAGSRLIVVRPNVFPPGTYTPAGYTLSGGITEMTPAGPMPVEDAFVMLTYGVGDDYQSARTDRDGRFEIRSLYHGAKDINVSEDPFQFLRQPVSITGDTSIDLRLVRR